MYLLLSSQQIEASLVVEKSVIPLSCLFNGEILERVKQIDGVYEGGYLTNLMVNCHGISMKKMGVR